MRLLYCRRTSPDPIVHIESERLQPEGHADRGRRRTGAIGPPQRVWRNISLIPRLLLVPREPSMFGDYLAALRVATSKMTAAARTSALTMYW